MIDIYNKLQQENEREQKEREKEEPKEDIMLKKAIQVLLARAEEYNQPEAIDYIRDNFNCCNNSKHRKGCTCAL